MKLRWRLAAILLASALYLPAAQALGTATLPDFASYTSTEEAVVVSISTVTLPRHRAVDDEVPPSEGDDLPSSPSPIGDSVARHAVRGLASGIIVSSDGQIVTSAHAVVGARELTVRLADGREFVGRVLGGDVLSDVAVVKIEAERLPVASLGDPGGVGVGDWVSAVGCASVWRRASRPASSAPSACSPAPVGISFLQTDVAVNPGSSGSPLFNLRGRGDRHQLDGLHDERRLPGRLLRAADRRRHAHRAASCAPAGRVVRVASSA